MIRTFSARSSSLYIVLIDTGEFDEKYILKTVFDDLDHALRYYNSNVKDAKKEDYGNVINSVRLHTTSWIDHKLIASNGPALEYNPYSVVYPDGISLYRRGDSELDLDWEPTWKIARQPVLVEPEINDWEDQLHCPSSSETMVGPHFDDYR